MIDFSQWYEQLPAMPFSFAWKTAFVVAGFIGVILGLRLNVAMAKNSPNYTYDSTTGMPVPRNPLGVVAQVWVIVIVAFICASIATFGVKGYYATLDTPPLLSESIESTFHITAMDWGEQGETFNQNEIWPDNGGYIITYTSEDTQQALDGKIIVQGHSIGITDADGAFLEGEYK